MSQFDRYTKTEYVEAMRKFLGLNKRNFLKTAGFIENPDVPRKGRLNRYPDAPIREMEAQVNAKAARCEAADSTFGERFTIARDYLGLTDAQISREVGISREMVRRWGLSIGKPTDMPTVADLLNVPLAWLEEGGETNLPANSHLGVRVGDEAMNWREQLFGMIQEVIAEIPDSADESYAQAYIELAVFQRFELAQAARRAGGRWQVINGTLLFSPWVPIEDHGLARRYWSDEVEAMIQEELATKPTVYGAWMALKKRCEAMGLSENQYPRRISLHKRVEKERLRAEQFGVDLNAVVNSALEQHVKH